MSTTLNNQKEMIEKTRSFSFSKSRKDDIRELNTLQACNAGQDKKERMNKRIVKRRQDVSRKGLVRSFPNHNIIKS